MMAIIGFLVVFCFALCLLATGIGLAFVSAALGGDKSNLLGPIVLALLGAGLLWRALANSPFAISMVGVA